jgi:methylthioribose-1-phosphate isomerase
MEIRGAPALGVAAAMGLALAAYHSKSKNKLDLFQDLERVAQIIRSTRPTARNLFWAVDRILKKAHEVAGSKEDVKEKIISEATKMYEEDIQTNRDIGEHGASLLKDGDTVGTICNAGSLATAGIYGTALGIIKIANEQGKRVSVVALETRPLLQGARLTAFELQQEGIDVKVITDGMIGFCFYREMIDKFICGADRILPSSKGYVFNKIGTYTVAIAARYHEIPFYVASPFSTFDFNSRLEEIVIEERNPEEITKFGGYRSVPLQVPVFNPAFDITPFELIDAIITEKGVIHQPSRKKILHLYQNIHSVNSDF